MSEVETSSEEEENDWKEYVSSDPFFPANIFIQGVIFGWEW